jgi:WD40 repeat protein
MAHASAHSACVTHLAVCGASHHAASCSSDGQVASWDVAAAGVQLAGRFTAHRGPASAVACSPGGGSSLASVGADGEARLWDLRSGACCARSALGAPGLSVCWAGDAAVVAGDGLGRLQLLDTRRMGRAAAVLQRHGDCVTGLEYSGGAGQVLSAGDDGAAVRTAVRAGELAAAGSPACGASCSFVRAACWLSPQEVLLSNWDGLVWCAAV